MARDTQRSSDPCQIEACSTWTIRKARECAEDNQVLLQEAWTSRDWCNAWIRDHVEPNLRNGAKLPSHAIRRLSDWFGHDGFTRWLSHHVEDPSRPFAQLPGGQPIPRPRNADQKDWR
tara:strand:- start:65921 stop:66274 length:354 start_codon:yes stop_codon:yes gene_type:complete